MIIEPRHLRPEGDRRKETDDKVGLREAANPRLDVCDSTALSPLTINDTGGKITLDSRSGACGNRHTPVACQPLVEFEFVYL